MAANENQFDDIIDAAANEQPTRVAAVVSDMMTQRIADRVDDMRMQLAQDMFGDSEFDDDIEIDIDDDDLESDEDDDEDA